MTSFLKSLSSNSLSKNKSDSLKTSYLKTSYLPSYTHQFNHFPKALSTNDDTLFIYVRHLVSGPYSDQKNYNEYIFNHLKNVIDHEFNTITLRNTSKFIMTLILLGNLHIYQNIVKHLLPSMVNKINESLSIQPNTKTDQVKPIWHLTQFFTQTLYVLAQWIPEDFYNTSKPSIFAKIQLEYSLHINQFKYFNMEKIVFCYRIIKDLGISSLEQKCDYCKRKTDPKNGKSVSCYNFKKKFHEKQRVQTRENMLLKQQQKTTDIVWQTGFEIFTEYQTLEEEEWSSSISSGKQQKQKLKSKRILSPDQYSCLNTNDLQERQMNLAHKFEQVKKNVKDMGSDLYVLEQKRLLEEYDEKRRKGTGVKNDECVSIRNLTELQKTNQLTSNNKSHTQIRSTARRQTPFPSMSNLSPRHYLDQVKKLTHPSHIQIFTNYLNSKSSVFQNKFKIALISAKGNVHLRKLGNFNFKCKTFCRQSMLKLKLFVEEEKVVEVPKEENVVGHVKKGGLSKIAIIPQLTNVLGQVSVPAIQFEYIEPKRCLDSYKSDDRKIELILNFGDKNQHVQIEPILIKMNNETMYLPVGYWHMVKGSSKRLRQLCESQIDREGSQRNWVTVCRKERVVLNKDIARSLEDVIKMLRRQFELVEKSKTVQQQQQEDVLKQIQLEGSLMEVNWSIRVSRNKMKLGQQVEEELTFTGKVEANQLQDPQNCRNNPQPYVSSLIDELAFVFGLSAA